MTDYTVNDVYAGLNQFKDYVQGNLPFKLTCFKGTIDPSVVGHPGTIPSLYMQVDALGPNEVLVETFIKTGPANTDWVIFGQGGGPTPMAGIWYLGTAAPSNTLGADTDWFFDETSRKVYYKTAGAWVEKILGAQWFSGATVPSNTLGVDGNWYLRTGANEIYLKSAGSWAVALSAGGGSSVIWSVVSTDFNIVAGNNYLVDTSAGPIIATLPVQANMNSQFFVRIKDALGTFAVNNLIIQKAVAATYTIANDATVPGNLVVDVSYTDLSLAYDGTNDNVAI